jgi:transcriptional regulator with XRE-family HTH domain
MDERDEIFAIFAKNVRYYRNQRGLSQSELAVRIGVDTRQVGRIEQEVNVPSIVISYQIAQALGITLNDLFVSDR